MVEVIESLNVKELWTGEYTATPAAASTGYIIVKDSGGTDRKLMVQA